MKNNISPLLYIIQQNVLQPMTTKNVLQRTNKIIYQRETNKKSRINEYVQKEMNYYPIKPKITKGFQKNVSDSQLSIFRSSKAFTLSKLLKEIIASCNYLCVQEARTLVKQMDQTDISTCRGQLQMLMTTLRQELRKSQLERFQEENIYLLISEIAQVQVQSEVF